MDYKPGDVFVGLVDFFAIVLPGAMLTFLFKDVLAAGESPFPELKGEAAGWVAFVLCAYLFGQFIQLVGASFMDRAYDHTYLPYKRRPTQHKPASDVLYARAKQIAGELAVQSGVLKWTRAYVRLKSGEASTELDRLEATSKFFRGVFVVLLIYALVLGWGLLHSGGGARSLAAVVVLLALSFWRFCEQRCKFTDASYRYFIELHVYAEKGVAADNV